MSDILNFKKAKLAKDSLSDVSHALKIVDMAIEGLELYSKYKVIKPALFQLIETKKLLDSAIKMYNTSLKKGKSNVQKN